MPRFAANLSMLFPDLDFIDRFRAAKEAGFKAVECLFPYALPAHDIKRELETLDLELVLFNLPPGDWNAGERGLSIFQDRRGEFEASLGLALEYASVLGTPRLHVMAGIPRGDDDPRMLKETYIANLKFASQVAQKRNITVLIEPLNQRDMPGYFLRNTRQALSIIDDVKEPNLKLQFDMYHVQITEGDVTRRLEEAFPAIGHVQIAGVPNRHEPDQGELAYPWLMTRLDTLGYTGWVGAEYRPQGSTDAGLRWLSAPAFKQQP
jgi:hydroxypyruvate isomerase